MEKQEASLYIHSQDLETWPSQQNTTVCPSFLTFDLFCSTGNQFQDMIVKQSKAKQCNAMQEVGGGDQRTRINDY